MFKKILIANRGEIACRVIRTARALGYRTVAVYSDADAQAPHVALADEAVRIGPAPAAESYLKFDAILGACRATKADALHPGYGFLSENAAFAQACSDAGVLFIGPPPSAIEAMGDKALAKKRMLAADVPCAPGYLGEDQSDVTLTSEARQLGLPLLVFGFVLGPLTVALAGTQQGRPLWAGWWGLMERGVFIIGPLWFAWALLLFSAGWLAWRARCSRRALCAAWVSAQARSLACRACWAAS